mgnify:CR=1 FL=1
MHTLENIDSEHKAKMELLIEEINLGAWTKKQKKRQKGSIISNIALYRCFIDQGLPKDEAKALVKEYSFHIAEKTHKLLKTFFHIPGVFPVVSHFYEKRDVGWGNMEKQNHIG